jgi:nicotinamide riboside kinase
MIKKIAIIGTHSAGKSTLSYLLAGKMKMLGYSVKIIQECARSCPYPINDGMSREACLWIYHEHMKKELEAMQKFDMIICDRACIDSFIYADAKKCFIVGDCDIDLSYAAACQWMKTYDKVLYVKPNGMLPAPDGVRSTDIEFQKIVELHFDEWMKLYGDRYGIETITSDMIFDNKKLKGIYKCLSGVLPS